MLKIAVKHVNNIIECCTDSASKLCFEYLEKTDAPLEVPQYSCLTARKVVEHTSSLCYSPDDCVDSHCFRPSLSNGTKLIEIQRRNQNEVLFLGHPLEVLHGIHVSEYIKSSFLPTSIPIAINKFCNFIIVFSGAFATLNLVPCFHFDGQHITRALVDVGLTKNIRYKSVRLAISLSITILGSGILVLYTVLIFLKYIYWRWEHFIFIFQQFRDWLSSRLCCNSFSKVVAYLSLLRILSWKLVQIYI